MNEQENPIVARNYRCVRCGHLDKYDLAALSASKLHSSPATGEEPIKPNCAACGAPLEQHYRRLIDEEPPPTESQRSWIANAEKQEAERAQQVEAERARNAIDPGARSEHWKDAQGDPLPELVPTPAAEPVPLEQASTKLPEPEPVV